MENSDHKKPQIDFNNLLPDVYKSDIIQTLNDQAFNRFFTKTDINRIAGTVGKTSNTQIKEPTSYRQANQLVPTMVSQTGAQKHVMSFKMFQEQMELLGVDFERFPKWGNALQFNWVPPVHLDKLINYTNYYWQGQTSSETPQYLTIENVCNQMSIAMQDLVRTIDSDGEIFNVLTIDYEQNTITIQGSYSNIFIENIVLYTTNSNLSIFNNTYWTIVRSYEADGNTIIKILESFAHVDSTAPTGPSIGHLWYDNSANKLYQYTGIQWDDITSLTVVAEINQQPFIAFVEQLVKQACGDRQGWDIRQWDDNQIGDVLWSTTYLSTISSGTAPLTPSLYDLWNDTTNDMLKQWDGTAWITVVQNFSAIAAFAQGVNTWDSVSTPQPSFNEWQQQNKWIPKTIVTDTTNLQRAQRPILEYDSRLELSEWTNRQVVWKYRAYSNSVFLTSTNKPTRIELEPIRGYIVDGQTIYLYNQNSQCLAYDANYTDSFKPGFKFRVTDNTSVSDIYTCANALYRSPTATDPLQVQTAGMVTVVTIEETFISPTDSTTGCMIVPLTTSQGDNWNGYHTHWLMTSTVSMEPCPPQVKNLIELSEEDTSFTYQNTASGYLYVTSTYQELTTTIPNVNSIDLDASLVYNPSSPYNTNYYAVKDANNSSIVVYKNGYIMYGGYDVNTQLYNVTTQVNNQQYPTTMEVVTGITLHEAVPLGTVIKICVAPQSMEDMGLQVVPVRTIDNDVEFIQQLLAGKQPVYVNLSQKIATPQRKQFVNQYPLFNVYDCITGEIVSANNIFGFAESATAGVDPYIRKRIDRENGSFTFQQHLLGQQNELLAYRLNGQVGQDTYWYNPYTNKLKVWKDGWTENNVIVDAGISVTPFVISDDYPPVDYIPYDQNELWYVTTSNTLMEYLPTSYSHWEAVNTNVIVGADPSLYTIWRHGSEEAIPVYTNSIGEEVSLTQEGSWKHPDQWFFNPEHENREKISIKELQIHANSILSKQITINGRPVIQYLPQMYIDYGLGGTIHDYNDSFDTLLSAAMCNITSIPSVIDFASREYNRALHLIQELFYDNITTILQNGNDVNETIISLFEMNELNSVIYNDTSAFNGTDGIRNWPATPAMYGLAKATRPYINKYLDTIEVVHHDGHRTTVSIDPAVITNYVDPTTKNTTKWTSVYTKQQLEELLAQLLVEVEQRLYKVCEGVQSVFDYNTLTPDLDEQAVYDAYMRDRYNQFTSTYNIILPYTNTTYNPVDPFTWNYTHCTDYDTLPSNDIASITQAASWQQLYQNIYGTPYPHLEPWRLQGYSDKPEWWDEEYLQDSTTRKWNYTHTGTPQGMWKNIMDGVVPIGKKLPDGTYSDGSSVLRTYNYVSVNISDGVVSGYAPDQLLPPYFVPVVDPSVRSLYSSYSQVQNKPISGDYVFGDGNYNEWRWKNSLDYAYDIMQVAFRMQPIRFVHAAFGEKFLQVDSLQVDTRIRKVFSHVDTLFHGDTINNQSIEIKGINQWYINLCRQTGYDASINIRDRWVGWKPRLTYQTAGIVNQDSIEVRHQHFSISPEEVELSLVNNGIIDDIWVDGFVATIVSVPPSSYVQDMQSKWLLQIDTIAPLSHNVKYYGVKSFPCLVDYVNNSFGAYQYKIVGVSPENHVFYVAGDQVDLFIEGNTFTVAQSANNDNVYQIAACSYEATTNRTRITVSNPTDIQSDNVSGAITLNGFVLPWDTGDMVVLSTDDILPMPLQKNVPYFVYKYDNSNSFKLAETAREAAAGITIELRQANNQSPQIIVSQIESSFSVLNGASESNHLWYHYTVDYSRELSMSFPHTIRGMQNFINFIDGHQAYQEGRGVLYDAVARTTFDSETGRQVSWQLELERFIDWAYGIKIALMQSPDRYQIVSNVADNEFSYATSNPKWKDGTKVVVSSASTLPSPLLSDVAYYIHNITKPGKVEVNLNQDITASTPTGLLNNETKYTAVISVNNFTTVPVTVVGSFAQTYGELVGIINEALVLEDAVCQLAQNSIQIVSTINELKSIVAIQDDTLFKNLESYVSIVSSYGTNDTFNLSITQDVTNTNNIIRLTSPEAGTLYISQYIPINKHPSFELNPTRENIWISTPQGMLSDVVDGPVDDMRVQQTLFDQYGRPITTDKLTVYRQDLRTHIQIVPGIANDVSPSFVNDPYNYIHFGGGHFFVESYEHFLIFNDYTSLGDMLYDPFLGLRTGELFLDYYESANYTLRPSMGGFYLVDNQFKRNIEGSIEDLQNIYNIRTIPEEREFVDRGRAITGYRYGHNDYLDLINVSRKSQFDFYRGMIQHKGTQESLTAFLNSKRVQDLAVDEYWAWKVAEYGEAGKRIYPEIKLQSTDSIKDDIRLMFLTSGDSLEDPSIDTAVKQGFEPISFTVNTDRWYQYPQQKAEIQTTMFLDSVITSQVTFFAGVIEPLFDERYGIQYWFDKTDNTLKQWNKETSLWDEIEQDNISTDGAYVYLKHDISDTVRIVRYNSNTLDSDFGTHIFTQGTGVDQYTNINSEIVRILYTDFEGIVIMFSINPSADNNNPTQIVDTKNDTTVRRLPMWHPAIGLHYHQAKHSIDIMSDVDPALYNSTASNVAYSQQPWNTLQEGLVWLDTSELGYMPYYDTTLNPDTNERLYNWGKQAEWSQTKVYQWVKSPVPPAEWSRQSSTQQSNAYIPQSSKMTGTAKKTMFSRTRSAFPCDVIGSPNDTVVIYNAPYMVEGDLVMFVTTEELPPMVQANTSYVISSIDITGNQTTLSVVDQQTGERVLFEGGSGILSLLPPFSSYDWIKQPNIFEKHYLAIDFPNQPTVVEPIFTLRNNLFVEGDQVDLYVNGKLLVTDVILTVSQPTEGVKIIDTSSTGFEFNERDIVVIARYKKTLTDEEASFAPAVQDDSSVMTQWMEDYEFTTVTESVGNNQAAVPVTSFFFWVENNITNETGDRTRMSPYEIAKTLQNIPIPYFIVQDPIDDPTYRDMYGYGIPPYGEKFSIVDLNEPMFILPIVYRQAILRKLSDIVRDDERYIARFICDNSKRNNNTHRKNIHEDWVLIRRMQNDRIDQRLWTALTEAVVGYKTDTSIPVPSLDRVQYDILHNTDTQYGLGENQAFVNKQYALATIQYYLNNIDVETAYVDIDTFLQQNSFDTPANIKTAMDTIYQTFPTYHVNGIWFDVLQDALVTKTKYKGLIKTSWISIIGSQQFDTMGNN